MSRFIKTKRELAGLTQEMLAEKMGVSPITIQNWESGRSKIRQNRYPQLSEVLNIPLDTLYKEFSIEEENKRKNLDNWPYFLFDEDTNDIIDSLHLNMAQQDLFGLLYIYDSGYLKKTSIEIDTLMEDLKKIPYGFIDKVGSIQFLNQVDALHNVILHVKPDFLMKVLKLNPEAEFNIKRLSKDLICEFIDGGFKKPDCDHEYDENFEGNIISISSSYSMKKARVLLPLLNKYGPVHMTDGHWHDPIRNDIPNELSDGIQKACTMSIIRGEARYELSGINDGLQKLAVIYDEDIDGEKRWMWKITDTGIKLLDWFKGDTNEKKYRTPD